MTDNSEITVLAQTNFRNQKVKFGIKTDDRRRHLYVLGKTGMGKTNMLETMIIQDIINGKGVAVVDPHGDLVEKIIKFVPAKRINDVIYFNPADLEFPIAFNVLEKVSSEHRHLVASGLLGVFQKIWADSWGPRLEYVLNNAILALLEYPGSTLSGIMKMLVDDSFRKKVIKKITDPVVKSFWVDEYSRYPDRFQSEAIAPIQNKVGRFLSSSMMRNVVGQVKSSINIREIMDQGKILLLNLSKGRIGEDNSALLGAMMVTKMQLAAMSRVDVPEKDRLDFYLYVDEFQNFATESFANILSEARKYHLNLILAHQYLTQLLETVQAAVFGNVGTMICFRVGAEDAELLVKEFTPRFTETDLVNLAKYNIYLKLMIDGVASEPFSAVTFPPLEPPDNYQEIVEKIIKVSRERYSTKREIIEDKISRWAKLGGDDEDENPPVEEKVWKKEFAGKFSKPNFFSKNKEKPFNRSNTASIRQVALDKPEVKTAPAFKEPKKEASQSGPKEQRVICDRCHLETTINFVPDPARPVYCKNCLAQIKNTARAEKLPDLQEKTLNQKSISLKEALELSPVEFKNKPVNLAWDNEKNPKTITPGQVVKF